MANLHHPNGQCMFTYNLPHVVTSNLSIMIEYYDEKTYTQPPVNECVEGREGRFPRAAVRSHSTPAAAWMTITIGLYDGWEEGVRVYLCFTASK